jgi:ribosome maturation factor RimP
LAEDGSISAPIDEPRFVTETGLDARVANLVGPAIAGLGYRLVRARVSGRNGLTVQVMAERPDGAMAIEDCEAVSRDLSPLLDVADLFDRPYQLEVSSPGIDRPLVRRSDLERARGQLAKVELSALVGGRKRFRGTIAGVEDDRFALTLEDPPEDGEATVWLPLGAIEDARLVLTEDLIRASLRAQKKVRKERKRATKAARREPAENSTEPT